LMRSPCLIGEWPIFNLSVQGEELQILFLRMSYFDRWAHRIVSGARNVIRRKARGDLRTVLDEHAGMIKVWHVSAETASPERYAAVGRMIAAFACSETWALLWPEQNEILLWEDDMEDVLAGGAPLDLFL
jgi:hypothetical protein